MKLNPIVQGDVKVNRRAGELCNLLTDVYIVFVILNLLAEILILVGEESKHEFIPVNLERDLSYVHVIHEFCFYLLEQNLDDLFSDFIALDELCVENDEN